MRRMQVLLEEWQYQTLRTMAEKQKKSLSAVLRQIIAVQAAQARDKDPLLEVAGIARTPRENGPSSETVDQRLYKV